MIRERTKEVAAGRIYSVSNIRFDYEMKERAKMLDVNITRLCQGALRREVLRREQQIEDMRQQVEGRRRALNE